MMVSPDSLIGEVAKKSHEHLVQHIAEKVVEHLAREVSDDLIETRKWLVGDNFGEDLAIVETAYGHLVEKIKRTRDWAEILSRREASRLKERKE